MIHDANQKSVNTAFHNLKFLWLSMAEYLNWPTDINESNLC
jgi:hypothetical protein